MALALCAFAEVGEKRFDVGEIGGLFSEPKNGTQAVSIDVKKNEGAFGAAQVSRKNHEE
jgi:hypothetical protein